MEQVALEQIAPEQVALEQPRDEAGRGDPSLIILRVSHGFARSEKQRDERKKLSEGSPQPASSGANPNH